MSGQRERADLFRKAVLWLEGRGGEEAVLMAFDDPERLDEAWGLPLDEFREALRARAREALAIRKGAA